MKRILLALVILFTALPAHAENAREEAKIGESYDKMIRQMFGVVESEKLQKYVNEIGNKLLVNIDDPEFRFHFTVLDDSMINAFAVPGGYVYVTRGMLAYVDNEAELAGVMGHEVGHVIGHHSYKQMQKSLGDSLLIFAGLGASIATGQGATNTVAWVAAAQTLSQLNRLGYGRDLELQADEFGLLYSYDAGYDPRQMIKLFRTLQFKERVSGQEYHGFSATHPDTIERIGKLGEKGDIISNRGEKALVVKRQEYLDAIEGIPFGKGDRASGVPPPYTISLYTPKKGDTFRAIARDVAKDESLAFDIAIMNNMRENDTPPEGYRLKVPVTRKQLSETERPMPHPEIPEDAPEKAPGKGREKRK